MSASHGCMDDTVVVDSFKEALIGRVGADRYRMWFTHGVRFSLERCGDRDSDHATDSTTDVDVEPSNDQTLPLQRSWRLSVQVHGQFALDRLRKNFVSEIRGAAMQACGSLVDVELCLDEVPAAQVELPLQDPGAAVPVASSGKPETPPSRRGSKSPTTTRSKSRRGSKNKPSSLSSLIASGVTQRQDKSAPETDAKRAADSQVDWRQPELPHLGDAAMQGSVPDARPGKPASAAKMTASSFVQGPCNQLAHTAMVMVCQNPAATSPLFLCGPTGTGKTHMLAAIAEQLRRRHRMRRVMHLSAEQFTNDFISSVGNSGITAFRRRYREVDALLVDDVQFLGSKKATLREMLYTVETLAGAGRPLIFSGLQAPTEMDGLSGELAGRMAAGLVCSVQPLDAATRQTILRRWLEERCQLSVPDSMIEQINQTLQGDGRVISGVVNVINTLQRMYGRMPTMDELRQFGGDLLRSATPVATLSVIEAAVCTAFHLSSETLRSGSQTRAVTQPRMLAMYLSRQLTSSAYAEIARYFGGKSHSTAISAEKNVKTWLENGKPIGRGKAAISAREAIDRIEGLLRCG